MDETKNVFLSTGTYHFRHDADKCIRELVAFYEISAEIATADKLKNVDDWISANLPVISREDIKDFQEILGQLAGAAGRMAEHIGESSEDDASTEPFKEAIVIPRKELAEIFESFYLRVALPISADRSRVTSRAF